PHLDQLASPLLSVSRRLSFSPHPSISFFSGSGAPLPLHSFPTRRSSDLIGRRSPAFCRRAGKHYWRRTMSQPRVVSAPRGARIRDRKSTRLNSSHVSISYAVFCLKKKIQMRLASLSLI